MDILHGKKFCVLSGNGELSKKEIKKMVKQFGGTVVSSPEIDIFCSLLSSSNRKGIKEYCSKLNHDILKIDWLIDVAEAQRFRSPNLKEYLSMTPETSERMLRYYDEYGDHYACDSNVFEVRELVDDMKNVPTTIPGSLSELDEILSDLNAFNLGAMKIYVAPSFLTHFMMDIVRCHLIFGGASLRKNFMGSTHALSSVTDKTFELKDLQNGSIIVFNFLTKKWIHQINYSSIDKQ